jgi:hypothetical protein
MNRLDDDDLAKKTKRRIRWGFFGANIVFSNGLFFIIWT